MESYFNFTIICQTNLTRFFSLNFVLAFLVFFMPISSQSTILIPADDNILYYKIGGGRDISQPAVSDTQTIKLDARADLGLNYSCGVFNPSIALKNSLNDVRDSFSGIERTVVRNATSAIAQLPMYFLARANPTLYNIFNNNLLGAHKQISVSTKSCEVMREQIAQGENPYAQWGSIAASEAWKKQLTFAATNGRSDINQAKKQAEASGGKEGVPWIGDKNAGGEGQVPIHVLSDTVIAAYNLLLNRHLTENSPVSFNETSSYLVKTWKHPQAASAWVTQVIGDSIITMCQTPQCHNSNLAGKGLLGMTEQDKQKVYDALNKLLKGETKINRENLLTISAPGVAINTRVIRTLQHMEPLEQTILTTKLSQEIAMQRNIDKALLARRLLVTGASIPVVANNHAAQQAIQRGIQQLDRELEQIVFEHKVRKEMVSSTIRQLLEHENAEQNNTLTLSNNVLSRVRMEHGAVKKDMKERVW